MTIIDTIVPVNENKLFCKMLAAELAQIILPAMGVRMG